MADLIRSILTPLNDAQNGPEPLLDTLEAYFQACCCSTEAAKTLHLSVRAVTYRLHRVRVLTGYDVDNPDDRLALQVAVAGARLLGWPHQELPISD
ncbi:PucR family transcriptional regulator [Fodinicola feengrottensis]|nr:helix-turn-helix domain-containing protein [Fodinicola feengrottensis]